MPRPRTTPLPRGITERRRKSGIVYLISFADQTGTTRQELAGPDLREAKRLLAQRRAEVSSGTYRPGGAATAAVTLATYAEAWLEERRAEGVRSIKSIEGHVKLHIVPALGHKRLGDLRARDVADWIESLKAAKTHSAKTIANWHGTLHSILERARFREIIVANPASLPRGMLPKKSKRKAPRFERAEIERLLTDERIDWHRRIFYGLQALGGLRCGEASGRRWRDYDPNAPQLGSLHVWSQYQDAPLKTSRDDDLHERFVPVHPALAELLAAWRRHGYAMTYGSHPKPDDWLVPDPRTRLPRTREQAGNALLRDLARLEIPHCIGNEARGRRCHAFRHAFISLARSDGATVDHLEPVTHNASGAMIDRYTALEWAPMCAAVSALKIDLSTGKVLALPRRAVASATHPTPSPDTGPQLDAALDASGPRLGIVQENVGGVGSRTRVRERSATCLLRA